MKTMRILVLMAATAALNWPSLVAVECGGTAGHALSAAADGCGGYPLDKIGTSGGPENEAGSQVPIHTALASRSSFATERTGNPERSSNRCPISAAKSQPARVCNRRLLVAHSIHSTDCGKPQHYKSATNDADKWENWIRS